ncbi:hypothetical protein DEQ92_05720 [Haloferax sp. Atlit-6N]|nr:hypothetical protein DEQ92_05720 [Haloferax sp. Atlit-6N]
MVGWECPTKLREASGLDPEAVHDASNKKARREGSGIGSSSRGPRRLRRGGTNVVVRVVEL